MTIRDGVQRRRRHRRRRPADDDPQGLADQAAAALVPAAASQSTEGVEDVTHANWFGGIYQDPKNFFANMAVDPESWLRIYPEFAMPEDQMKAWLADRTGAIVGVDLAKRFGWKIGDRVPLQGVDLGSPNGDAVGVQHRRHLRRRRRRASTRRSSSSTTTTSNETRSDQATGTIRSAGTSSRSTTRRRPRRSRRSSTRCSPTRRPRPRRRPRRRSSQGSPSRSATSAAS